MLVASSVDWTTVICAAIAAVSSVVCAALGYSVRRQIRTPSGDAIGLVAERAHDLAAVSAANVTRVAEANGIEAIPAPEEPKERLLTGEAGGRR